MNQEQLDQIQIQIEQDSIKYKCDLCPMKFQQYRSYMYNIIIYLYHIFLIFIFRP